MSHTRTIPARDTLDRPVLRSWRAIFIALAGMLGTALIAALMVPCASFALPEGRTYEMVSPVYKGGYGATKIQAVALNGQSVAFFSPGIFNGAPSGADLIDYLARRTSTEWQTVPLMPPASIVPEAVESSDVSPTLELDFAQGVPGPNSESPVPEIDLLLHSTALPDAEAADWESFALQKLGSDPFVSEEAADPNFCHMLLGSTTTVLLPAANGTKGQKYEFDRGCNGEPVALTLVAVNNQDSLINRGCGVDVGVEDYGVKGRNRFNAISRYGSEVFFTDCVSGPTGPHQLFVRLAGARTVEVSRPLLEEGSKSKACSEVSCEEAPGRGSAEFDGASEDGSRVFFTAPLKAGQAPLVPGDTDVSNNLYMASIGCPEGRTECEAAQREVVSLTQVSHDPNGGAAEVQGVLEVAPDGQRAYFVAGGDLLSPAQQSALEGEGRSVPRVGAENLYAYDASGGTVAFIGDLCSGPELSGSVSDYRCSSHLTNTVGSREGNDRLLWSSQRPEAQTAGADGRFLVFSTYAQLTGDDANAGRDVYRYDAQTGVLERVSIGENGYGANGNSSDLGASIAPGHHGISEEGFPVRSQYELDNRAVGEDGSRIVFTSAEALSPLAINGLANVYEWHEGSGVSLISSGSGEEAVTDVVISPSGGDVFFDTPEGLVPQDTDGAPDVYDARLERPGEAFPVVAAQRRQCAGGDGCQGPLSNPAPLLIPGSVSQASGGNFATPNVKQSVQAKKKAKAKRKDKGKAKKRGRSSRSRGGTSVRSSRRSRASGRSGR